MSEEILSIEQLRALLKAFKKQHAEEYHLRALGYFGSYAHNGAPPKVVSTSYSILTPLTYS